MEHDQENEELIRSYLEYLQDVRTDRAGMDDEAWERLEPVLSGNGQRAWKLALEILGRCDEEDVTMVGAGLLQTLLFSHPKLVERFENELRSNDRFLRAFQYVAMTGVPLAVQRRLNEAMAERGVDPKFLVEYDEVEED